MTHGGAHGFDGKQFGDAISPTEAAQAGGGEQDGIVLAFVEFAEAGIEVAAHGFDDEVGPHLAELGGAAEGAGADLCAAREFEERLADDGVARVFAGGRGGEREPGGQLGGHVFERVDGDLGLLQEEFPTAARWVDLLERLAGDDRLWRQGFQLGDWLDPDAPPDDPAQAKTDKYLVATAYFAWSTSRLAEICDITNRMHEARHYRALAAETRAAFRDAYVLPGGRMVSDTQTAYALAIAFELLDDPALIQVAGDRLAELVAAAGNRISTGFVGTPLVSHALTTTGHVDRAYDLLLERECPSWLYQVTMGATTVWERWDAMLPDGTVNSGQMTSFNHYALGAVADWLHRVVAGLAPAAPGYRRIRFAPRPGGGLTSASATHETPYGTASIAWRLELDELIVAVVVPTGTSAVVDLPGRDPVEVGSGAHEFRSARTATS